ncbi:MAG: type II secretion system protein [Verrucomicrobiota bacterium]
MKNSHSNRAFTLIEIMVVVAIMAIIMAMGVPSVVNAMRKEGMRKAISELTEACNAARAAAIMSGSTAELVIHPRDRTFTGGKISATFPDNVFFAALGIYGQESKDDEIATVHFYPKGTCDQFMAVLNSTGSETTAVSLDEITGQVDIKVMK